MQHIKVPYGETYQEADFPDSIPVQVISPAVPKFKTPVTQLIEEALDNPIASSMLKNKKIFFIIIGFC